MDDEELIRRTLEGELEGFAGLVEKYQRKVIGMIYHMTNDYHASEDLGQEIFLEVYRSLRSYDAKRGQFSTWLYRVARNKTLNAIKKKRPLFLREIPEAVGLRTAFHEMAMEEFHGEFERILNRLPIKQKVAFVWAEIEELPYEEIAKIEGTSVGTIRSRIHSARQRIREAMNKRKDAAYE